MEDRETARMRKYGESKTTRIMMATVPHVISGLGLRKFQADGFLLTRVYMWDHVNPLLFLAKSVCVSYLGMSSCGSGDCIVLLHLSKIYTLFAFVSAAVLIR